MTDARPQMELPQLADCLVRLRPVDADSVDLLIRWTLDPVAQGPHKSSGQGLGDLRRFARGGATSSLPKGRSAAAAGNRRSGSPSPSGPMLVAALLQGHADVEYATGGGSRVLRVARFR